MKILAAANHTDMLDELETDLSGFFPGAEIIRETDALMAGKYAFNQAVDVVFAEADMKRMNGLQLIQFVRREHPGVKSFLIGTEEELSESFFVTPEDVTGILTYPFGAKEVREVWQASGLADAM